MNKFFFAVIVEADTFQKALEGLRDAIPSPKSFEEIQGSIALSGDLTYLREIIRNNRKYIAFKKALEEMMD